MKKIVAGLFVLLSMAGVAGAQSLPSSVTLSQMQECFDTGCTGDLSGYTLATGFDYVQGMYVYYLYPTGDYTGVHTVVPFQGTDWRPDSVLVMETLSSLTAELNSIWGPYFTSYPVGSGGGGGSGGTASAIASAVSFVPVELDVVFVGFAMLSFLLLLIGFWQVWKMMRGRGVVDEQNARNRAGVYQAVAKKF